MNTGNEPKDPKGLADIGGAGNQHNDWGHSDVGSKQADSQLDDVVGSDTGQPRQGVIPGEEAGELQTGLGGIGSLSTGNAGSRQSEGETQPGGDKGAMQSGDKGNAGVPESGGQRTRQ